MYPPGPLENILCTMHRLVPLISLAPLHDSIVVSTHSWETKVDCNLVVLVLVPHQWRRVWIAHESLTHDVGTMIYRALSLDR